MAADAQPDPPDDQSHSGRSKKKSSRVGIATIELSIILLSVAKVLDAFGHIGLF